MSATFKELTLSHPCFSAGAKPNKGGIHLPVSPGCNINCYFCGRSLNSVDMRPATA